MIEHELKDYIEKSFALGASETEISNLLKAGGWSADEIAEALHLLHTAPITPQPEPLAVPIKPLKPIQERVSIYSIAASLALFTFLFVIISILLRDVDQISDLPNRLVVYGFVAAPVFLMTAIASILIKKDRFRNLLYPGYIISGWLLFKLFIETSRLILERVQVWGIYLVILMIITGLMTIGIYIQKSFKHH